MNETLVKTNPTDESLPAKPAGPFAARLVSLFAYNALILAAVIWYVSRWTTASSEKTPLSTMIWLTSLLGAGGGTIHGLASLSVHVGRATFHPNWTLFYLARPFVGAGMALITYLVLSSGIGGFVAEKELVLFAWAALAGLYSQPALDKLRDLFVSLFKADSNANSSRRASNNKEREAGSSE
jgi:hypothetical protein